ncbi:MAG: phosphotransferase family protein [Armatimonadota bacterium]
MTSVCSHLYFIIRNADDGTLLLAATPTGWQLPTVTCPVPAIDVFDTTAIGEYITQALHLPVRPLYAMTKNDTLVVAGEMPDAAVTAGYSWYTPEAVIACLRDPVQHTLVTAYHRQRHALHHQDGMPWMEPQTYQQINHWLVEQLHTRSASLQAPPKHVKSSYLGMVMRVQTTQGTCYVKTEPRIFSREIPIMAVLSSWNLSGIPQPVFLEETARWMVTSEVDGPTLAEIDDVTVWESALRHYARLQQAALPHLASMRETDLFYDHRPATVACELDRIADELDVLLAGHPDTLSPEEYQAFRRCIPPAQALCEKIAVSPVPNTLEHGDLHPGNIRITADGPVILDWAWSSIAPPFHSLALLLHEKRLPAKLQPLRMQLRDVYLQEWTAYAPLPHLITLVDMVQRWRDVEYIVGDAAWVRAYLKAYPNDAFVPHSYLEWTLRMRQHYLIKVLRRFIQSFRDVEDE